VSVTSDVDVQLSTFCRLADGPFLARDVSYSVSKRNSAHLIILHDLLSLIGFKLHYCDTKLFIACLL
jgi:hypothetical protein